MIWTPVRKIEKSSSHVYDFEVPKNHNFLADGLIIHNSESRSQHQNKENALAHLSGEIRKALYVPKKRMATRMPKWAKELRLRKKAKHSTTKKMRSKKYEES